MDLDLDLTWDGRYLGRFPSTVIYAKTKVGRLHYWTLMVRGEYIHVTSRGARDRQAALIDEFKPIFGLPKVGSHIITMDRRLCIITRSHIVDGVIHNDPLLSEYLTSGSDIGQLDASFIRQVRQIFCFRELLAQKSSRESSISVCSTPNGPPYPVATYDTALQLQGRPVLARGLYNKWFKDVTVEETLSYLLEIHPGNDTNNTRVLARIKFGLQDAIKRVDPDAHWCEDHIMRRLMDRLSI